MKNIFAGNGLLKIGLLFCSALLLVGQSNSADNAKQIEITDASFTCLTDMQKAGDFFIDNLLGNLEATLAVALSESGGKYPAGSVLSLIPSEVMVKHQEGWNPATNDWEFFELAVSAAGSTITSRGTTDVVNRFGGNCFGCHQLARPEWDLVCGTDHGCAPLPVTREQINGIQASDPRCVKKD
jgi:hypothetical protein